MASGSRHCCQRNARAWCRVCHLAGGGDHPVPRFRSGDADEPLADSFQRQGKPHVLLLLGRRGVSRSPRTERPRREAHDAVLAEPRDDRERKRPVVQPRRQRGRVASANDHERVAVGARERRPQRTIVLDAEPFQEPHFAPRLAESPVRPAQTPERPPQRHLRLLRADGACEAVREPVVVKTVAVCLGNAVEERTLPHRCQKRRTIILPFFRHRPHRSREPGDSLPRFRRVLPGPFLDPSRSFVSPVFAGRPGVRVSRHVPLLAVLGESGAGDMPSCCRCRHCPKPGRNGAGHDEKRALAGRAPCGNIDEIRTISKIAGNRTFRLTASKTLSRFVRIGPGSGYSKSPLRWMRFLAAARRVEMAL